jgi:hypothetical protein
MDSNTIRGRQSGACDMLTMGQCASIAACPKEEINIALQAGELSFHRFVGRRWIDPPALRNWMMRRHGGFGHVA